MPKDLMDWGTPRGVLEGLDDREGALRALAQDYPEISNWLNDAADLMAAAKKVFSRSLATPVDPVSQSDPSST